MSTKRHHKTSRLPGLLALGGIAILVAAVLTLKQDDSPAALDGTNSSALPQVQLDQALEANQPVLAFFHSDNCEKCLIMMDVVAQVYPEVQDTVALVDVNVYQDFNRPLLKRMRVQYIPTLVFYDRSGNAQTQVGVMTVEQFTNKLSEIAGGQ